MYLMVGYVKIAKDCGTSALKKGLVPFNSMEKYCLKTNYGTVHKVLVLSKSVS